MRLIIWWLLLHRTWRPRGPILVAEESEAQTGGQLDPIGHFHKPFNATRSNTVDANFLERVNQLPKVPKGGSRTPRREEFCENFYCTR